MREEDRFGSSVGLFPEFVKSHIDVMQKKVLSNPFSLEKEMIKAVIEEFELGTNRMSELLNEDYTFFVKNIIENSLNNVKQVNINENFELFEKRIRKCVLDYVIYNIPKTRKKLIQRKIIEAAWSYDLAIFQINNAIIELTKYRHLIDDFPILSEEGVDTDILFKKYAELQSATHIVDRIYHLLIESLFVYCIITRKILNQIGHNFFEIIRKFMPRSPYEDLNDAKKNFFEGNFRLVLAQLRFALEFAFLNKLNYMDIANRKRLGWLSTPYFKDVIKGCNKMGIQLPARMENLRDTYTLCGEFIHTGYREDIHKIWKILIFTEYVINEFLNSEIQVEIIERLVFWLNENARIKKDV